MKGKLLVLEGPDGAGKTTVLQSLLSRLGSSAKSLSFPGRTPGVLGELVYRLHHNSKSLGVTSITPTALQALHIAAHLDVIENTIIPLLEEGSTVVLDRFWWSTFVYGTLNGVSKEVLHHLIEAEKHVLGSFQPNHLFLLERTSALRDDAQREWTSLSSLYDELAKTETAANCYPVHRIVNATTADVAVAEILRLIGS